MHSRTTILLATDQQRSVLNALVANRPHPIAYTPYGHRPLENGLLSLLGFNGERPDPLTGHYHLGNGYRQFNPVLMRFNSPDSWSPFGKGGVNAYAYCLGDPVNRIELKGHSSSLFMSFWKGLKNRIGVRTPSKSKIAKPTSRIAKVKPPSTNNLAASSKSPQGYALGGAKDFDLNTLTPAELELNYKPNLNTNSEKPIRARYITNSDERLANLKSAQINVIRRLVSDPPETLQKRKALLKSINREIAELTSQQKKIRGQNPAISI
jgi:RHS repeat-associated protein